MFNNLFIWDLLSNPNELVYHVLNDALKKCGHHCPLLHVEVGRRPSEQHAPRVVIGGIETLQFLNILLDPSLHIQYIGSHTVLNN